METYEERSVYVCATGQARPRAVQKLCTEAVFRAGSPLTPESPFGPGQTPAARSRASMVRALRAGCWAADAAAEPSTPGAAGAPQAATRARASANTAAIGNLIPGTLQR